MVVGNKCNFRLFSGVVPRVLWISVGGAIFLGVYEEFTIILKAS